MARRSLGPEPTTVHWHGLRAPNAMDGVSGLTQDAVAPGESFIYDLPLPDAGTFWYRSHHRSHEQVARGLAGPLIVEEADGGPDVDGDHTLMLQDWRLVEPADISTDFDNMHDRSHAGRLGNYVTANGLGDMRTALPRHSRHRLRLINSAPARIFELSFEGLAGWIIAVDGMPLEYPRPIGQTFLPPGGRIDVVVDVTADEGDEAYVLEIFQGEGFSLATFEVTEAFDERRDTAVETLKPNPAQEQFDPFSAITVPMIMEGGAMRGLPSANHKGERVDGQTLSEMGLVWALNGQMGLSDEPFIDAAVGDVLRVPLVNNTAFSHVIHLHGHSFQEIRSNGGFGLWRDTIIIDPGQTRDIAFRADNPGRWLIHSQILQHQAGGMETWINVAG